MTQEKLERANELVQQIEQLKKAMSQLAYGDAYVAVCRTGCVPISIGREFSKTLMEMLDKSYNEKLKEFEEL